MSSRSRQLPCIFCNSIFYQHRSLQRHISNVHTCVNCGQACILDNHQCQADLLGGGGQAPDFDSSPWVRFNNALQNVLQSFRLVINDNIVSIEHLFRVHRQEIAGLLVQCLRAYRNCRFSLTLTIQMQEIFTGRFETKYFRSGYHTLLNPLSINVMVISNMNQIIRQVNSFIELGSSWTVRDITFMDIDIVQYRPFRGGANIVLPPDLRRRRGIANIPIQENCYRFCIYASYLGLSSKQEIERTSNYTEIFRQNRNNEIINFSRVPLQVSLREILLFERDNPTFSVNVFGFQEKDVFPIKIVQETKQFHSNLLLFTDEESQVSHYLFIFDFNSFMCRASNRRYYCFNCLFDYATEAKRDEHYAMCKEGKCRYLKFFNEGEKEIVKLHEYSLPRALILFFDFETINNPDTPYQNTNKILQPCHFAYVLVTSEGEVVEYGQYTGRDAATVFVDKMDKVSTQHMPSLQLYKDVVRSSPEGEERCRSSTCCICLGPIRGEMHRHHNHTAYPIRSNTGILVSPGDYYGSSCKECNMRLRVQNEIPCLSHNYARFDSMQMIRGLAHVPMRKQNIIAKNANTILSLKYNKVQFMDSFLQLPFALKDLVRILRASGLEKFKITRYMFREYEDELDNLLFKQFFPYNFITWENLDQNATSLPPREAFYNSLRDESLSEQDYAHACYMYQLFNCKTIAEYMRIYCLLDVCLLADVYLNHRKQCLDFFKIECLNFISCPSMSFRLILGMSGQGLDYIADADMYLMCKKAKRGGVVNYTDRLAYANYPTSPSFNQSQPTRSLIQLDFSAMYGVAMCNMIPVGNYRFLSESEVASFNPLDYDDNGPTGFLVSLDVDIDPDYHDYFSDLPPFPEKIKIDPSQASSFQQDYTDDVGNSFMKDFKTEQLITSLYNKSGYVLHNFLLKLYLQLGGIRIRQIHKVVSYSQNCFMRQFVEMAISKRNSTDDESLKNYFKLLINSGYGFAGLNVENFCEIKICKTAPEALQICSRPNFKAFSVLAPSLAILESSPVKTVIRNHLLVSTAILDRAKLLLYKTWYLGISKKFGDLGVAHKLLYVDTDSFLFRVDLDYEPMLEHLGEIRLDNKPIMDFSYLPTTHRLYNTNVQNQPGYLKSETKYNRILAFACLKKKFYSLKIEGADDKMRGKGVPNDLLRKNFTFETYKQTILTGNIQRVPITFFKRLNQQIVEVTMNKMAFNSFSISRYLIPPRGIETLPWGHRSIVDGSGETVSND